MESENVYYSDRNENVKINETQNTDNEYVDSISQNLISNGNDD